MGLLLILHLITLRQTNKMGYKARVRARDQMDGQSGRMVSMRTCCEQIYWDPFSNNLYE